MPEHHSTISGSIQVVIHEMHRFVTSAAEEAAVACDHIDRNEQNMAIGTVAVIADVPEQAVKLCKAAFALHSLRL